MSGIEKFREEKTWRSECCDKKIFQSKRKGFVQETSLALLQVLKHGIGMLKSRMKSDMLLLVVLVVVVVVVATVEGSWVPITAQRVTLPSFIHFSHSFLLFFEKNTNSTRCLKDGEWESLLFLWVVKRLQLNCIRKMKMRTWKEDEWIDVKIEFLFRSKTLTNFHTSSTHCLYWNLVRIMTFIFKICPSLLGPYSHHRRAPKTNDGTNLGS